MQHELIILVGAPGVGKTYLTDYLVCTYPDTFAITRSVTTREPRNADDHEHYEFLDDARFAQGVASGRILATAHVRGKQYGLDLSYIREMLKTHNGIIALVAETVDLLRSIPDLAPHLRVIFLKPASRAVLEKNLNVREPDPAQRAANLALAETWAFPERPDATFIVRGEKEQLPQLAQQLFSLIDIPKKSMENTSEKKILIATCALLIIVAGALIFKYIYTLQPTKTYTPNNTTPIAATPAPQEAAALAQAAALLPSEVTVQTIQRLGDGAYWVAVTDAAEHAATYVVGTKNKKVAKTGDPDFPNLPYTTTVGREELAGVQIVSVRMAVDGEGHIVSTQYFRLDDSPTYLTTMSWWNGDSITFSPSPEKENIQIALEKVCTPENGLSQTCTITGLKEGERVATFKTPQTLTCELNQLDGVCRFPEGLGIPTLSMGRNLTFTLPWGPSVSIDLEHPLIGTTSEAFEKPYPFQ